MFWLVLILLTAVCWYLALSKPSEIYQRDWRLKPFHLKAEEEQDFHVGVRQVVAFTGAIFFSVCLVIALIVTIRN
jgi:hypothetical protein